MAEITAEVFAHTEKGRLMRRATYASVLVAAVLIAAKAVAWVMTGSVSMLSTLTDSGLDLAASLVNLLAVRHALEPADHDHRFGHGKAEALAGLGQAGLIAGSAVFLLLEGTQRLLDPQPVERSMIGIGVVVFSIAMTLVLVTYQRSVARRTGSLAVSADSMHYASDLAMNAGVIVGLVLAGVMGLLWADGLVGVLVALWIGNGAREIFMASYNQLMDRELSAEERDKVREIATSHPDVHEIHDLRTRASGSWQFIQFHVEMDPKMTLAKAHRISEEVEAMVGKAFPDAEVFIHQDPVGHEDSNPLAYEETAPEPGAEKTA